MRVVIACYQCGRGVKVDVVDSRRQAFCGQRCKLAYYRSFTVQPRRAPKPSVPVMEAWPDMMVYIDRAQRRRPSYHAWSLFAGSVKASFVAPENDRFPQHIGAVAQRGVDSKC